MSGPTIDLIPMVGLAINMPGQHYKDDHDDGDDGEDDGDDDDDDDEDEE